MVEMGGFRIPWSPSSSTFVAISTTQFHSGGLSKNSKVFVQNDGVGGMRSGSSTRARPTLHLKWAPIFSISLWGRREGEGACCLFFVLAVREFSHVHVKSLPDPLGIGIGIVIATRSLCPLSVCVGANDVGVPDDQAPLDGAHDIHVYVCARARAWPCKRAHIFSRVSALNFVANR